MNEGLSNRALYHAKSGSFAGFYVSVPVSLLDENLRKLFDNVRSTMKTVEEESEGWFSLEEYVNYVENIENIPQYISEDISIATRMKLRRAAKRTSIRRARKRYIKRGIRKNTKALAKRAYTQIKTLLRKRLTGGRSWSSLPLASRVRIDNAINKRRPILKRLVKNRITKMPSQETKRLQRVRLNNSFEPTNLNLFLEARSAKLEKEANKDSHARGRESVKNDPSKFLSKVMVVKKQVNNKPVEMLIDKASFKSHIHSRVAGDGKVTMKTAKDITSKDFFRQTKTSMHLFGELDNTKKERKTNMSTPIKTSNETPEELLKKQQEQENKNKQAQLSGSSTDYDATDIEKSITTIFQLKASDPAGYQGFLSQLSSAQQDYKSQKFEAERFDDQKDARTNVVKYLKQNGISPEFIEKILSQEALITTADRVINGVQVDSEGNETDYPFGKLSEHVFLNIGRSSYSTSPDYLGTNTSPRSDILAISRETLIKVYGDQIKTEKDFITYAQEYVTNQSIVDGSTTYLNSTGKSIKVSKKDVTDAIEYMKKGNVSASEGIIPISMKMGAARYLSGTIDADAQSLLLYCADAMEDSSVTETISGIMKEITSDLSLKKIKIRGKFEDNLKYDNALAKSVKKAQDTINNIMLPKILKITGMKERLIESALSGSYKFSHDSLARASYVLTAKEDGSSPTLSEINLEYVKNIANDVEFYFGSKSSSLRTAQENIFRENYNKELNRLYVEKILDPETLSKDDLDKAKVKIENEFLKETIELEKKIDDEKERTTLTPEEEQSASKSVKPKTSKGFSFSGLSKYQEKKLESIRQDLIDQKARQQVFSSNITERQKALLKGNIRPVLRSVWQILNIESKSVSLGENTNKFTHNLLLKSLLENNYIENDKISLKDNLSDIAKKEIDQIRCDTYNLSLEYAGADLEKLMTLYDTSINRLSPSKIDLTEYATVPFTGKYNAITINSKVHNVPISMSEYYINIGQTFLAEAKKRNYRKEYDNYQGTKEQIANRTKRVLARRILAKMGRVRKGDKKDVDHKDGNPQNNSQANLKVMDRSANRAKH